MYNRYIPQPDGSFQRHHISEPAAPMQRPAPPPPPPPPQAGNTCPSQTPGAPAHSSVSGFLRNLLPADFDTGDLIVVLLLLLLAGDCPQERNSALLTLVLYLSM